MAVDFDKIFAGSGSTYTPTDEEYLQGFDFLAGLPPSVELFNALLQIADLKSKELNNNKADIETLAESTGYGIIDGFDVTVSGMTANMVAGTVHLQTGKRATTSAVSKTAPDASATLPRIDTLFVSSAKEVTYYTGEAAASPVAPTLPAGSIALYDVNVAAGATSITVTDRRCLKPTTLVALGYVNVKYPMPPMVSAKGDGTTDDLSAIQNILNSAFANGWGNIFIPDGTYRMSGVLNQVSNVRVVFSQNAWLKWDAGLTMTACIEHAGTQNVTYISPKIDGNNSKTNGLGFANSAQNHIKNIQIFGAHVKNVKHDRNDSAGKGITFQYGIDDVQVNGYLCENSYVGIDTSATSTSPATNVQFSNVIMRNVQIPIFTSDIQNTTTPATVDELNHVSCLITDISLYNCGLSEDYSVNSAWERVQADGNSDPYSDFYATGGTYTDGHWSLIDFDDTLSEWSEAATYVVGNKVKITNNGRGGGIIVSEIGRGLHIGTLKLVNHSDYGTIGALFKGTGYNIKIDSVIVSADLANIISFDGAKNILPIHTRKYIKPSDFTIFNFQNIGKTENIVEIKIPYSITNPYQVHNIYLFDVFIKETGNISLFNDKAALNPYDYKTYARIHNAENGGTIEGTFGSIYNNVSTLASVNSSSSTGYKHILNNAQHIKVYQSNSQLKLERIGSGAGSANIYVYGTALNIDQNFKIGDGLWNGQHLILGTYHLWVDTSARLRIKSGTPTSDTDGTVVGSQS